MNDNNNPTRVGCSMLLTLLVLGLLIAGLVAAGNTLAPLDGLDVHTEMANK